MFAKDLHNTACLLTSKVFQNIPLMCRDVLKPSIQGFFLMVLQLCFRILHRTGMGSLMGSLNSSTLNLFQSILEKPWQTLLIILLYM